jgi:hypothetical protein
MDDGWAALFGEPAAEAAAAATLKESEVTAAFAAVAAKQKLKSHVAEASLAKDEAAARAASIAAATTLKEAQDAAAEAQASAAKRFAEVEAARLNTARLRVVGRLEHFALSSKIYELVCSRPTARSDSWKTRARESRISH